MCGGNEFIVRGTRVNPGSDGIHAEFVLNVDNWDDLCDANNLEYGDVIVFTKVGNNSLNMIAFNAADGSSKTQVQFLGMSDLNLIQPKLDPEEESECIINVQFIHSNRC